MPQASAKTELSTSEQVMPEKRMHFRVLILDPDKKRMHDLENSFYSMYDNNGAVRKASELAVCEDAKFYYISNEQQLESYPDASAFNAVWMSFDFPNCLKVANLIYIHNPFCYQVFYGENSWALNQLLKPRPIGYVRDIADVDCVFAEMAHIWKTSNSEKGVLNVSSHSAYCTIPLSRIIYCQSQGTKTYIFVSTKIRSADVIEDDIWVKNTKNLGELFAYIQNKTLDKIEQTLPSDFVRVHQSYIVNSRHVKGVRTKREGWRIIVEDSECHQSEIPVSERYRPAVKKIFIAEMQ